MSNFSIVSDITKALRGHLFNALANAPGVSMDFTDMSTDISLSPPQSSATDGTAKLSLYLYHLDVNNAKRNQLKLSASADELRLPPLPLELMYLVTPLNNEDDSNQIVIGRVLQFIYDNPIFKDLDGIPIGSSFGGGSPEIRITPYLLSVEQLTQLWNAFDQPFRLSLAFKVDVVSLDSAQVPELAPRVTDIQGLAGIK